MAGQMAAMMTGVVLAMSAATLPASANPSHITQDLSGGEQQTQLLSTMGAQVRQQKWSIDEKDAKVSRSVSSEDRATFNKFKAGIEEGLSPLQAAKKAGAIEAKSTSDWSQKRTNGQYMMYWYQERTNGQYMMYFDLSKKGFLTLRVDCQTKVVKVLQMGNRPLPYPWRYTQPLLQQ